MKDTLLTSLVLVLLLGACYFLGYRKGHGNAPETPTIARTDTLLVRDTIRLDKPVPVAFYYADTVYLPLVDTVRLRDTLYLAARRECRVYEDSLYRAVVSGVQPSLDELTLYRSDRIVTVTTVSERRWGFTAGAQLGFGSTPAGWLPYAGFGVTVGYRF